MMNEPQELVKNVREILPQLVDWRRDFHQHPELGFHEARTANRVSEILTGLGCRVRTGVGGHGVLAELGSGPPVVAIRADMDALPILEANDIPYASRLPGVMHACGHDAHTTMALGVAKLMANQDFPGTLRFLFQPAEEVQDEQGISGAPHMIADGAMDGVEVVLGLHVDPSRPVGEIALLSGPASAGVDTFYITIFGKGGHCAAPHKVVDPIYLAAHVTLALHGIVSRRLHPTDAAVVSIGTIHGGQIDNVIPDRVELSGSMRYFEPEVQKSVHMEIERASQVARTLGGDYELKIELGYPPMVNAPAVVERFRKVGSALLGEQAVVTPRREMGAEDFGYLSARVPGAMFSLGCRIEGDERKLHSPHFDLNERCLPVGVEMLASTALDFLNHPLIAETDSTGRTKHSPGVPLTAG